MYLYCIEVEQNTLHFFEFLNYSPAQNIQSIKRVSINIKIDVMFLLLCTSITDHDYGIKNREF